MIFQHPFQNILRRKKKRKTIFFLNMEAFLAEMPLSANLFRLGSSIQKYAGSRSAAPLGGKGGQAARKTKSYHWLFLKGWGICISLTRNNPELFVFIRCRSKDLYTQKSLQQNLSIFDNSILVFNNLYLFFDHNV